MAQHRRLYAGVFVTALATLMLEITLTRILSVVSWFYVSYSAISFAVLGMTAGSLSVFFTRAEERTPEKTLARLARASLAFGWTVPAMLLAVCIVPMVLETQQRSVAPFFALLVFTAGCALPFFFSGVIVTTILGHPDLAVGRAYASDLVGSATACLLVVGGLSLVDPFSLVLVTAAVAMSAVFVFGSEHRRVARLSIALLLMTAAVNHLAGNRIQPIVVKDRVEDRSQFAWERWNSLSRITVFEPYHGAPWIWGASPKLPQNLSRETIPMKIDGVAFTAATRFGGPESLEHLKYDVSNIGYFLKRKGKACIIGIGGGRDLQSALHFGYSEVIGIDVNPTFVDVLKNEHREFAGLADRSDVTMEVDEARSYLARHPNLGCTMIQMSLIDTYAATAAGAFTLSENALYTLEAWKLFYARLAPAGLYSVSRWNLDNDLSETGRLTSLAVTALLESGVKEPAQHLMLIGGGDVGTLLMSKSAFTAEDVADVRSAAAELQYDLIFAPGSPPVAPLFQNILSASSRDDLESKLGAEPFNLTAPTDENPYFFNILKLGHLKGVNEFKGSLVRGCLKATSFLVQLIGALVLLLVATIIAPLLMKEAGSMRQRLRDPGFVAGISYFALIGFGFMVLEMGLIQKLNLYLGHPIYSLSVALFTLILSAGVGSALSERLTPSRWAALGAPLLIAVAIEVLVLALQAVLRSTLEASTVTKIALSIALTFPVGVALGLCLPFGLRLSDANARGETPWLWAVNGVSGVLGSSIALLLSIYAGVSVNFHVAAGCYVALGLVAAVLRAARAGSGVQA